MHGHSLIGAFKAHTPQWKSPIGVHLLIYILEGHYNHRQ